MKVPGPRAAGLLIAGLLLGSSACAYGFGPAQDLGRAHGPPAAVRLHVTNNSGVPMEVFAAASGTVYRVGTVHPGLAASFVVRPAMVGNGSLEFLARSAAGGLVRSGPMLVSPGDVVDFGLERYSATSAASIRAWRSGRL